MSEASGWGGRGVSAAVVVNYTTVRRSMPSYLGGREDPQGWQRQQRTEKGQRSKVLSGRLGRVASTSLPSLAPGRLRSLD